MADERVELTASRRRSFAVSDLQDMSTPAKLIFLCGKMAAGKSTLAKELADREHAVLLVQDEFLDHLFPGEITDSRDACGALPG